MIHNEERKLPEDWQTRTSEFRIKKGLKNIEDIQNTLNSFKFGTKILPHLANPSDQIAKEVLSLQAMMLFNANHSIQVRSGLLSFCHLDGFVLSRNLCWTISSKRRKKCFSMPYGIDCNCQWQILKNDDCFWHSKYLGKKKLKNRRKIWLRL